MPTRCLLPPSLVAVAALLASALLPAAASATFHLVSIREVFPGDNAAKDAEYVELQAYSGGQEFIAGHSITFRDATGSVLKTETFDNDVSDGRNQMTILIATPAAETRFGVAADEGMAPNLIEPAGGAICWEGLDCVSWGNFDGLLPAPAGSPASPGGIADGMALRRSIAPGCPTLLESGDDKDSSAADFSEVFPAPRPNSIAPTERACGSGGGGGGAGAPGGGKGKGTPETTLRAKPAKRTTDRTATFRFASDEAYASFQCKLDGKPFRGCRSPLTTKRLTLGAHTFKVRARSEGQLDPSPAVYRFTVVAKRR